MSFFIGQSLTPTKTAWFSMMQICQNKKKRFPLPLQAAQCECVCAFFLMLFTVPAFLKPTPIMFLALQFSSVCPVSVKS